MKTPEEIKKGTKCPWCGDRMRFDADSVHCWFKCDSCLAASPKTRRVWDNAKGDKDNWDINKANARLLAQQFEAQVPRWISVEERLPEDYEDVVIIMREGASSWYRVAYREYGGWSFGGGRRVNCEVTHWMPLPEPPEEDEK